MRRAQSSCSLMSNETLVSSNNLPSSVTATALMLLPPRSMPRAQVIVESIDSYTHAPPAVHRQHLAGDEFRFVAHEENGCGVEILRPANASAVERLFGFNEIQNRLVALRALGHRRGDERRRNDVEANVLRRVATRGGSRKA